MPVVQLDRGSKTENLRHNEYDSPNRPFCSVYLIMILPSLAARLRDVAKHLVQTDRFVDPFRGWFTHNEPGVEVSKMSCINGKYQTNGKSSNVVFHSKCS